MQDFVFAAITIAFFAVSVGYVRFCDRIRWGETEMSSESIVMLLVSVGLMVYLLFALLRPEKFW